MILGDHPNCRYGLPVTLEWDFVEYEPIIVDEYEFHHSLRRPLRYMFLSAYKRKDMFLSLGYGRSELKMAKKQLHAARAQRQWTQITLPIERFETAIESFVRKIKKRYNCNRNQE